MAAAINEDGCSPIRPISNWYLVRLASPAFILLVAIGLTPSSGSSLSRTVMIVIGCVGLLGCVISVPLHHRAADTAPTVIRACRDRLTVSGTVSEAVERTDVGVVVFTTWGKLVFPTIRIYRPDKSLAATWTAAGNIPPWAFTRSMKRYGYPWAIYAPGSFSTNVNKQARRRSTTAPDWTLEVIKTIPTTIGSITGA